MKKETDENAIDQYSMIIEETEKKKKKRATNMKKMHHCHLFEPINRNGICSVLEMVCAPVNNDNHEQ